MGAQSIRSLYGESGCVTEQLKDAISPIKEILKIDQGLQLSVSELEGSYLALQEAALTLRDYAGGWFSIRSVWPRSMTGWMRSTGSKENTAVASTLCWRAKQRWPGSWKAPAAWKKR